MKVFKQKKKTVEQITESLTKIQRDLLTLNEEKDTELSELEGEKIEINNKISFAENEKTRGNIIYKNITNLLGGSIQKTQDK